MSIRTLLTTALAIAAAAPAAAHATSVAYIDNHNLVLSTVDGTQKAQLTTDGTEDRSYWGPSQADDGRTIVSRKEVLGDDQTYVYHLFGADGKRLASNVIPVDASATIPVYPIGTRMDRSGTVVAYGYSACSFACQGGDAGYWLTFSDHQSAYPTDPQGESGFHGQTFFGRRILASDGGGRIFAMEDHPDAPFRTGFSMWMNWDSDEVDWHLYSAEVQPGGDGVLVDVSARHKPSGETLDGIALVRRGPTIPGETTPICLLPTVGNASSQSWSPDGRTIAWKDDQGVKTAPAPTETQQTEGACNVSPTLISATGSVPQLGGADVPSILRPPAPGPAPAPGTPTPAPAPAPGGAATVRLSVPKRVTPSALRRGLTVRATVPAAGKLSARLELARKDAKRAGIAAARPVVLAARTVTVRRAGEAQVTLKLSRRAARRASRLRGRTLTVRTTHAGAAGSTTSTARLTVR